ncbi:MAG: (E)-4-hydroxy-3-methylbut-2-enyl-diphosphate synthase [Bacteroidetes bacterium]|nr:(E)-4-hydroxy-3-methylbut-2-enyl-diphosphate synthase [Bacteroidota bacterium]
MKNPEWKSSEVYIGDVPLGGNNPIRIQSMTDTDSMDTAATVKQCIRIIKAGADYVRITAQNKNVAKNLALICSELRNRGYSTPIIADVHFSPGIAGIAAGNVDKVRINPGNFADKQMKNPPSSISEEEYNQGKEKIKQRLLPLLNVCLNNGTAIRIGVNHGSLSNRIMIRYGDTPEGMVESAMEFLRICKKEVFINLVVSLKSSNTREMVKANRLLVKTMQQEKMNYPLHLGVTEAGDGEDGRIRSAVGIGTLLNEGIGDTIRVSLTEDPEKEIPAAINIAENFSTRKHPVSVQKRLFFSLIHKMSGTLFNNVKNIGGNSVPVVIFSHPVNNDIVENMPDYFFVEKETEIETHSLDIKLIVPYALWLKHQNNRNNLFPLLTTNEFLTSCLKDQNLNFVKIEPATNPERIISAAKGKNFIFILELQPLQEPSVFYEFLNYYHKHNSRNPLIIKKTYNEKDHETFIIKMSGDLGLLFLENVCNGIWLINEKNITQEQTLSASFGLLQASRVRISRTEFISCPSCGRTLFDLQKTTARVKKATGHLKGLKIAVMGCIVNGPGEMADADYGYVGAGKGKITLYKKKEVVRKNIPSEDAVYELVGLIKENGDWKNP